MNLKKQYVYSPVLLHMYIDLKVIRSKYDEMLHKYVPYDFYQSLQKLQDKLSDDQIRM